MRPMTILRSDVPAFLAMLAGPYRVFAPQRMGQADIVFSEFHDGAPVDLDFVNSVAPPKTLFFPARETLFHIEGSRRPVLQSPPADKPVAIFGMRSCDATGTAYLERFFAGRGFEDESVVSRIRMSLTMTLSCHTPGPDCFCVCCEGGPWLTSGFDIQFTDLGERLLADVGTDKGAAAIDGASPLFRPAELEDLDARSRQVEKADSLFARRSYVAAGTKRISLNQVPPERWEQWAEDCQGCGGCCFVCPTCSCFTVADRASAATTLSPAPGDGGRSPSSDESFDRERAWDACLYEGFTREASGHNPRAAKADRLKRRFFHKMSYQYVELMGRHGCVGCGRCVATCMGGLDISSLLERIHDECP
jgi:sulfhydrogenase subunit beta (sulfur reductase)